MQQVPVIDDASISYRIEPFYFERNFFEINRLAGFETLFFTKERFYEHIDSLMFLNEKAPAFNNQIAKSFKLEKNHIDAISYFDSYEKKEASFPDLDTEYDYIVKEVKDEQTKEVISKKSIRFKIENVQVIISEMQVGFLVYDLKVVGLYEVINGEESKLPQSLENYEWAMYYLRKMQIAKKGHLFKHIKDPDALQRLKDYGTRKKEALKNNTPFLEEEPLIPEIISVSVKWTDLTTGLLKELGDIYSFTNDKKVGHHTLLYSSIFVETPVDVLENGEKLEKFELMIANKAYKISHGYKETYYKETSLTDIVRPFDHVFWSLSAEGISNIVYTVLDKNTMSFFNDSFKSKRKTNYYYMYILALLQKYSLLYFTIRTTDILFQSSIYTGEELTKEEREEELKRTQSFHGKTLKFTIHGYYEQVSYHTHYNDMYEQLIKALRIPELQRELTPKTESFHQVIESLVQKQDMNERELEKIAQDKQNHTIQTITYFFLPTALATGFLGMNVPMIKISSNFYLAYAFLGVTLITALLSVFLKKEKGGIPAKVIITGSILLLIFFILWDLTPAPSEQINGEPAQIETGIPTAGSTNIENSNGGTKTE